MTDTGKDMSDNWLTISDAAHVLGVTERTIYRRISEGKLEVKLEGTKRYVSIDTTEIITDEKSDILSKGELIEQLRSENQYLRQKFDEVQQAAEQKSERQDTIILQLTRHLEQSQRLLEYHEEPWYRRWFRRKRAADKAEEYK